MRSSALSSRLDYTATVCCTASVTACWRNSRLPRGPERSSACHDRNKDVWPHYSSTASTPLTSSAAANHLQVGDDHLQMPSRSGAVLPAWRVYPRFVRRRQRAAAVGRQRDTRRDAYKDYDRSARLCRVGPGDMEQPARWTADFNSVHRDICKKKTQKSSLWLL